MNDCPKDCHKKAPFIFRKVVIPASVDDDSKHYPENGAYHNAIVYYEATGNAYIYSSDGIPTKVSADMGDIKGMIDRAVEAEAEIREAADQDIWTEIETIEAASDVVDVVGTYAELQAYDTSKLQDNDLIKVLADETRDDAITYYRWSTTTETFTYVGSEGPYYTSSEVDTLLGGKQNTLTAGSNIQINGNTISATDTTYSVMTGATSGSAGTSGLVPAPSAGDQNKALKGDGTWGEVSSGTIFYMNAHETGSTRHLYKASDMTGLATMQDIIDANEEGQVIVRISTSVDPATYSDMYLQNAYVASGDYQMIFLDNQYYYGFDTTLTSDNTFQFSKRELQTKLTAGSNITINGNTISATDTTYSDFVGTDGLVAGTHGLVPAPATTDADKYLKSDGTWATVQGGSSTTMFYVDIIDLTTYTATTINLYTDDTLTTAIAPSQLAAAYAAGPVTINCTHNQVSYGFLYVVGRVEHQDSSGNFDYTVVSYLETGDGQGYFTAQPNVFIITADENLDSTTMYLEVFRIQGKLTAGSNIAISNANVISVTGMPVLYGSQGQNTDGAVTQKLFTDTVGNVETILQTLNSGAGVP